MIELSSITVTSWVMALLWPFIRILAFVAVAPIFGENSFSRLGKVGVAFALALVIAPTMGPMPAVDPVSFAGVWLVAQQVLIGAALGMVMRVVFAAVQAAGDYVGLQMGLGFASFFSAALGTNAMVLAQLLNTFALLLFLAFDGHLVLVHILADTFIALPVGAGTLGAEGWRQAAYWGAYVFTAGLGLALPLVAALLTINLAMGVLNRASPQLSIFSVGFPLTLLAGLTVLFFITPELGAVFARMFVDGFDTSRGVLQGLAAPG